MILHRPPDRPGLLVAVEGIDNLGKSTAVAGSAERLRSAGYRVHVLTEFGTDVVGRTVRRLVRGAWSRVDPVAQPLLIAADRIPRIERALRRLVDPRQIVICDRYLHSAVVYQALAARRSPDDLAKQLRGLYGRTFQPADLVLRLEGPVATAVARGGTNVHDPGFLARAATELAQLDLGGTAVTIDATLPAESVARRCVEAVRQRAVPVIRSSVPAPALARVGRVHAREVLFVPRGRGGAYLQRKRSYPAGLFRIAGGGVEAGETPGQAVRREMDEEAGLRPSVDRFHLLGCLVYNDQIGAEAFVSDLWQVVLQPGEGIDEKQHADGTEVTWRAFADSRLERCARRLASSTWRAGWGRLRAAAVAAYPKLI